MATVRWRPRHPAPTMLGTCPVPKSQYDRILLGHGSGGQLTADLIRRLFVPAFGNEVLAALEDQATVSSGGRQRRARRRGIAFTTDSFVVRPLFFPGGDIGRLAVHGTVNDLAVGGAGRCSCRRPSSSKRACRWPTCSASSLRCGRPATRPASPWSPATPRSSIAARATRFSSPPPASAWCREGRTLSIRNARPGDRILVSGTIGDHGIAIMSVREGHRVRDGPGKRHRPARTT